MPIYRENTFRKLTESSTQVFGTPKTNGEIHKTSVAVLGAIEQNFGIYQIPSFYEQVTTMWNDPVLKEGITMFAQQVVATGYFLTANQDYTKKVNGKTALETIKDWCDKNNLDLKLYEVAVELQAFGNSFFRLDKDLGFIKIPVESVWHAVRVKPEIPLQEQWHLQLMPIYGGNVVPWGQFIHFRINITGYNAPFGQGLIYSLLAKPVDSMGNIAPSIYDIRLNMRASLNMGFRKFSFGNEIWAFPNLSNEDFASTGLASFIANMSETGNRIATNSDAKIVLSVPERTQSYDAFIKQMRDEFFMSVADPSLKLGLEQGFTKATSVTASEVYQYKVSTMRQHIKLHIEDLFKLILDKQGFDGITARIQMNFGPEETAVYNIADIFAAVDRNIVSREGALELLTKYHKWDLDIAKEKERISKEGKEEAEQMAMGMKEKQKPMGLSLSPSQTSEELTRQYGVGATGTS